MTVTLAQKMTLKSDKYPARCAEEMWERLQEHAHNNFGARMRLLKPPEQLVELCKAAYNIALLFRSSRIDYEWQQRRDLTYLESEDTDIIGTTGVARSDRHKVCRIVFGGVVRGNRNTGRLRDGQSHLLKPCVVIDSITT
jgi:hypothetical protein